MTKRLLLIFVRTPTLGQVKTRLARTIGDTKALQVYEQLLQLTHAAALPVNAVKWVCYADAIPEEDLWSQDAFLKLKQPAEENLGFRMHSMFAQGLIEGHSPVLIIGSDCPGLTTALLEEAYLQLEQHDVVLGPAQDGGYYLLGLNYLVPELFEHIPWSTENVMETTLAAAKQLNLKVALLPELADVDEEADLAHWPQLLATVRRS